MNYPKLKKILIHSLGPLNALIFVVAITRLYFFLLREL